MVFSGNVLWDAVAYLTNRQLGFPTLLGLSLSLRNYMPSYLSVHKATYRLASIGSLSQGEKNQKLTQPRIAYLQSSSHRPVSR